ncbi:MAG: DUF4199 domain-containing protein [Bacteroidota bacterium]
MENTQKPGSKIMLHYGIILGVASILMSVVLFALGMHYDQDWKQGTFGIIITIAVIFLGIKKYKEFNEGYLTLGEAIKTGLGIALIGGIISVIYTLIFMNFIEPDFIDNLMTKAEETLLEQFPDFSDEQLEQAIAMQRKMASPLILSAFSLIGSLFFGLIISLVSGLILKKNKEQY